MTCTCPAAGAVVQAGCRWASQAPRQDETAVPLAGCRCSALDATHPSTGWAGRLLLPWGLLAGNAPASHKLLVLQLFIRVSGICTGPAGTATTLCTTRCGKPPLARSIAAELASSPTDTGRGQKDASQQTCSNQASLCCSCFKSSGNRYCSQLQGLQHPVDVRVSKPKLRWATGQGCQLHTTSVQSQAWCTYSMSHLDAPHLSKAEAACRSVCCIQ